MSKRIEFVTILVLAIATVAGAGGCGGASKTAKAASPSPLFTPPPAWVASIAAEQGSGSGAAHPVEAWWALVDVPVGQGVKQAYILVFHGDFTSPAIMVSGSTPTPVHWLKLTIDASTHMIGVAAWTNNEPSAKLAATLHPFKL
jgi:hypothetical protein